MNSNGHSPRHRLPARLILFFIATVCATALFAPACSAATKIWIGHDSGNWSGPNNWRPTGAPQNGDNLVFDPSELETSVPKEMHNDIVELQIGRLEFCDYGWSLDGNELTVSWYLGDRQNTTNFCSSRSFVFNCPLKIGGGSDGATFISSGYSALLTLKGYIDLNGHDLYLNSGDRILVSGQIIGTGNVIATCDGFAELSSRITFDGPTGNTFRGKLIIRQLYYATGEVIFDKEFGLVVNDALLIGERAPSLLSGTQATCKLARSHQIGDNAEVCVTGGSKFLLDGHTETIGSLCLTNNTGDTEPSLADTGGSTLSAQGDITAVNDAVGVTPTIRGKLGLPGPAAAGSPASREPNAPSQTLKRSTDWKSATK